MRQGEKVSLDHKLPDSIDPYWGEAAKKLSQVMGELGEAHGYPEPACKALSFPEVLSLFQISLKGLSISASSDIVKL